MRLIEQLALIIILICFSTSISSVDILIDFWLLQKFLILIGTSLTILAVLFTCIYTTRTSAEANMHNANANFVANVTDKKFGKKKIGKIWLKDSFKWRNFCAINTKIATMFLYSFILLAITFFIALIVPFIKISLKLIGFCIIFLTLWSIINLLRGFLCYRENGSKLYKSNLFSWDSVPEDDNEKLIRFLKDDLNIGWAKNAKIRKSNDGMTISISKDENSAEIKRDLKKVLFGPFSRIEKKEGNAILKIRDGRTYNLKVETVNDKLNIHKSKEESWLTKVSRLAFRNGLLNYECSPRFSIIKDEAREIYDEYEQNI